MDKKNFDELIKNINEVIQKLESDSTSLEDSVPLFESGLKNIKEASERLSDLKQTVKKVLEDNSTEIILNE
ncbi:exodeoxyribonuclease VII small subunit [Spiroplasma endosymbiont of Labia minor]|uniref:exodeoxyribonuclease VII small subunit n=1 Tax=Spiroplasma endosymbiont of Labia minor TaxID=3066305 RepID=UPI0030CBCE21